MYRLHRNVGDVIEKVIVTAAS